MLRKLTLYTLMLVFIWPISAMAQDAGKKSSLEDLIRQTLRNNPDIQASLSEIGMAEGDALQAGLRPNPEAAFEIENFGGRDDLSGFDGAEATLGIQQKLETAGKRSLRQKTANYAVQAQKQMAIAQTAAVIAQMQKAVADYAIAEKRLGIAEQRIKLFDDMHRTVKKRVSAAAASDIEHTRTDIEQQNAVLEKAKAEKALEIAKVKLERFVGQGLEDVSLTFIFDQLPERLEKSAVLKAIENNALLEFGQFNRDQAATAINLEEARAIPDPTLGFGVRRYNDSDQSAFVAGISVPLPVFNRNQGDIAKARAALTQAEAELQGRKLSLKETALKTLENFSTARQEIETYQNNILPSAKRAYDQAVDGYVAGRFSFLDLLDAQRTLYEVEEARLESLSVLYAAKAETDYLMEQHVPLIEQFLSLNEGDQK